MNIDRFKIVHRARAGTVVAMVLLGAAAAGVAFALALAVMESAQ